MARKPNPPPVVEDPAPAIARETYVHTLKLLIDFIEEDRAGTVTDQKLDTAAVA